MYRGRLSGEPTIRGAVRTEGTKRTEVMRPPRCDKGGARFEIRDLRFQRNGGRDSP